MERVTEYLAGDHARLGESFDRAIAGAALELAPYETFRAGLLRHIAIEEKLLFPAVKPAADAALLARMAALHADHARIGMLLAVYPTAERCRELAALLERHDADEEGPTGVYAACEAALGPSTSHELAHAARAFAAVRVGKFRDA